jgi:hypothetical protein
MNQTGILAEKVLCHPLQCAFPKIDFFPTFLADMLLVKRD